MNLPDWHIINPDHTPFADEEVEDDQDTTEEEEGNDEPEWD
jgi:hypothetical protein